MAAVRTDLGYSTSLIRAMRKADLEQILGIEHASYRFPWRIGHFEDCLKAGYRARVLLVDQQVIGYSLLQFSPGEAHLLNICVSPTWQSKGWGECLLQDVLGAAEDAGSSAMYLETRASNVRALGLYKKYGFRWIGLRKDYYKSLHGREHADVLKKKL